MKFFIVTNPTDLASQSWKISATSIYPWYFNTDSIANFLLGCFFVTSVIVLIGHFFCVFTLVYWHTTADTLCSSSDLVNYTWTFWRYRLVKLFIRWFMRWRWFQNHIIIYDICVNKEHLLWRISTKSIWILSKKSLLTIGFSLGWDRWTFFNWQIGHNRKNSLHCSLPHPVYANFKIS